MNKLLLPSIIVALLVAGVAFYFLSTQTKQSATSTQMVAEQTTPTPAPAMMSLKELMAGGAQQCTYTADVADVGVTNGTVFVSDGKVRGDFTITGSSPENTMEGSMISDGDYMYTWSSAQPQGLKIAITDEMKNTAETATNSAQPGIDLGEKMDYDCKPWIADASKFVPPANIVFNEMKVPTSASTATGSGMPSNADLCSACDDLEGEQQSACLTALKCE